jgi:predicted regulator of Ras-like GTPase activity (Roadblock/LC7/MglB family)
MENREMENILKDINAVVGVTGSFVCDNEGQILAKLLPDVFDEVSLSSVGRIMAQTIAGLELARRRKVGGLELVYREGRLVVKNLRVGHLCILCVPAINVPLLNLTANVAARKLVAQIKADQATATEKLAVPPHRQAQGPVAPTVNGTFFSTVERELTRLIGPMAAFVLEEQVAALGHTREAFPRDKAQQLVEMLTAEIEDEGKRPGFQQIALDGLNEIS